MRDDCVRVIRLLLPTRFKDERLLYFDARKKIFPCCCCRHNNKLGSLDKQQQSNMSSIVMATGNIRCSSFNRENVISIISF